MICLDLFKMKYKILILILSPLLMQAQEKKDNLIKVKGVSFSVVVNKLLDEGWNIMKIDSNYQTVTTDFRDGRDKTKWMKLRYYVRVKDSTAFISGNWVNAMLLGQQFFGSEFNMENSTQSIEFTFGNPKNCFIEMQRFALSFNKPIEYSRN